MSCFVRSIHRTLGAGEQVADPLPESLCFRGVRRAVGVDPVCRCLLGAFHGGKVAAQHVGALVQKKKLEDWIKASV